MFDRHRPGIVYLRNIVMRTAELTDFGHEKLLAYQCTLAGLIQSIVASEEHNRQNQTGDAEHDAQETQPDNSSSSQPASGDN